MNIVIFFQALFVSISLQYLIIESAQSHSLWSRYYLVFDSQLAAVFRSPASLQQAHDFAHKFSLHQSALTYGCSDYITGQRLASESRSVPHADKSMLPLLVDAAMDRMCFLLISRNHRSHDKGGNTANHEEFDFILENIPAVLKFHASIYSFIESSAALHMDDVLPEQELTVLFRPESLPSDTLAACETYFGALLEDLTHYTDRIFANMFWTAQSTQEFYASTQSPDLDDSHRANQWFQLAAQFDEDAFQQCHFDSMVARASINTDTVSFALQDFGGTNAHGCLAYLAAYMAEDPSVNFMAITNRVEVLNYRARSIQQSAQASNLASASPYTVAGLTGTGQIVSVADTGVDTTSCYFSDTQGAVLPSILSSPVFDLKYRKVIQYNYNRCGDSGDEYGGHGTHVSGTAVGSVANAAITSATGQYDGVAPDAKLSVMDLGKPGSGLCIPAAGPLYNPGRLAGSRIGSNSWGTAYVGAGYYNSQDTDNYLFNNMDTAIFFAAGNTGQSGARSLTMQASGKNSITVGSSESTFGGPNITNVAFYSSQGPTFDNRIKPDLVAPGDSLVSVLSNGAAGPSCGTLSMTGTSMATPAAAGIGLLVRQYFMSPSSAFWAGHCNLVNSFCRAFTPSGVLVKAVLLQSGSAMRMFHGGGSNDVILGAPPDQFQGYGRVTLSNVLPLTGVCSLNLFVEDLTVILENGRINYSVQVLSGSTPLKVTLAWYDPPSVGGSTTKALLQDLNLLVTSPTGVRYNGNGLSVADSVNTNEQVQVAAPAVGTWTVQVQANALPVTGKQSFSIVITAAGTVR